jgi:hypothetical protein
MSSRRTICRRRMDREPALDDCDINGDVKMLEQEEARVKKSKYLVVKLSD